MARRKAKRLSGFGNPPGVHHVKAARSARTAMKATRDSKRAMDEGRCHAGFLNLLKAVEYQADATAHATAGIDRGLYVGRAKKAWKIQHRVNKPLEILKSYFRAGCLRAAPKKG